MPTIRINVTDEQGTLLDSVTLDADDFKVAQRTPAGALSLLAGLDIGYVDDGLPVLDRPDSDYCQAGREHTSATPNKCPRLRLTGQRYCWEHL